MKAATPPEAEALANRIDAILPWVRITEVLHEVARANSQGSQLIHGIAARAPIRELIFVQTLGHARMPLTGSGRITVRV